MTDVPIGSVILYLGAVADGTISTARNALWPCRGGSYPPAPAPAGGPVGTPALLPRQWLVCDGRNVLIRQYPGLYGAIADVYSTPSTPPGSFGLPDLRGAFVRGVDAGAGVDPDLDLRFAANGAHYSGVGSMQCDAMQQHQHADIFKAGTFAVPQGTGATSLQQSSTGDVAGARTSTAETRALNMAVHYLIRCA